MTINELCERAHQNAIDRGWYDDHDKRNLGVAIALIHSELSEALEELRKGWDPTKVYTSESIDRNGLRSRKPEGFTVELADAVIRIADLCGSLGVDLEAVINHKMDFNESRPAKHGKAF